MKKFYFALAAIMIISLASCQKEQDVNVSKKNLITVTLTADKAGDEIKAAAVEGTSKVSYEWTETDRASLKLFQVSTTITGEAGSEVEKEVLTEIENPTVTISSDYKTLTITATVEENSKLRAVVAGEFTSSSKPKIKVIQSPAEDNFDPATDILVSEDVTVSEATALALKFSRQAVVNKMTLKNLVEGEKVKKVIISSESTITGYYDYESAKMLGQNKEITLNYNDVAVGSSKEFPVYFVAMPNSALTLTVVVKTDMYNYTKTIGNGTINFTLGGFTKFGVNLSGCGEEVVDVDYSGEWIIAGTHSNHDIAATAWSSGNVVPASEVTIDAENEVVTVTGGAAPYKMTISRIDSGDYEGMYTIVDANGNYLSATGESSNNYLKGLSAPNSTSYWSIEKNLDGTYNVIASLVTGDNARNEMRVNYNNGNPRVSCYAASSAQPKVVLYPFDNIVVGSGYNFRKVSSVSSGKQYLIVASASSSLYAATPITLNYGYPAVETVTATNNVITQSSLTNAFTITEEASGFTIKQSDNRYWYQTGTYTSFNVNASPTSGQYFTIVANADGTFTITNKSVNKYLQYSTSHSSYGSYADEQGVMPSLYEYQDGDDPVTLVSIAITTAPTTTSFSVGGSFVFDGVVTATYSDNSTADVTSSVTYSGNDLSTAGTKTVTVSYTEGGVTKTATYSITVTSNTPALALPQVDNMEWADNGSSDDNATLSDSDLPEMYSTSSYAYKGIGGLKLGNSSNRGSITTANLNLSSAYYIEVHAKAYGSDTSTLEFLVDGVSVYDSSNLTNSFATYYFNASAATSSSKIQIKINGKRGYINYIKIANGAFVAPPVINVTSDNPMAVDNTNDMYAIEYTIDNPVSGVSISASANVAWIHDFDCSVSGEVSFEVDAQASGAAARSGIITLSYTGAPDVTVTVNQAAGSGGSTTKTFTISSSTVVSSSSYAKYETTDWIITFGGNNKSIGTNSNNRSKCNLSSYAKYAVSPVTTTSVASAFASKTSLSNVKKVRYTFNGGSNQTSTKVYLLYSSNGSNFSQISLSSGTQGAAISSGTEYEFAKCSGYFAVLFEATNSTGNWRIDDVELTFTYEE